MNKNHLTKIIAIVSIALFYPPLTHISAQSEPATIEFVSETFLIPINDPAWTHQEYVITDSPNIENETEIENLPKLYSSKDFGEPYEGEASVSEVMFATYTLSAKSFSEEIIFKVIGPTGEQKISVDVSEEQSISVGVIFWEELEDTESKIYTNTSIYN